MTVSRKTVSAGLAILMGLLSLTSTQLSAANSLSETPSSGLSKIGLCKTPVKEPGASIRTGFPRHPDYIDRDKRLVVQLIYAKSPNAANPEPPAEDARYWIENMGKFLSDMSGGHAKFEWRYENKYFEMAKPIESFRVTRAQGGDPWGLVQATISASDRDIDFSDVDMVISVFPPDVKSSEIDYSPALPGFKSMPFRTKEGKIYRATMVGSDARRENGHLIIAHEIGHLLGLTDLYSYEWKQGSTFEDQFPFMGQFDHMNHAMGASKEWLGWNRWIIGFLSDRQVRCVTNQPRTVHQLEAISSPMQGAKLVVVRTGKFKSLVIESRRNTRHDAGASEASNGLLVYRVDTRVFSGRGPIRVVRKSTSTDPMYADAPLREGESLNVGGFTVTNLGSGPNGDTVEVLRTNKRG
jgi:M6 family metalloprotease-like protein